MIRKIILSMFFIGLFINASNEMESYKMTCLKGRYQNIENDIYQIEYSHSIKIKDTYNIFFKLNKDNNVLNIICISKENKYEIYKELKKVDLIKENNELIFLF